METIDDSARRILVRKDTAGNLFWLQGTQDQTAYEKIADSAKYLKGEPLPAPRFN